ncbi:MAG: aldo/keto reductase [Proteobacteria bacterium]|nr:aldo/keto reductase [Pseudomonadota bacterium]
MVKTNSTPPLKLALGTAQWGQAYGIANRTGMPPLEEVDDMLRAAGDAGVRLLDTARAYGEAESRIGELLGAERSWRVVTKLDPQVSAPGLSPQQCRDRVLWSLDASRAALRRPQLDAVLLHRAAHRTEAGGAVWEALVAAQAEGSIQEIGISTGTPEEAWEAIRDPEVQIVQVAASLLDRRLPQADFFAAAAAAGKTAHVRSIFLQGIAHLPPYALPQHLRPCTVPLTHIRRFADARGFSVREVFLAFARSLPGARPLVGCETLRQLREILADWRYAAPSRREVGELAERLPTLEPHLLDPSGWDRLRRRPAARAQATATGSATATRTQ